MNPSTGENTNALESHNPLAADGKPLEAGNLEKRSKKMMCTLTAEMWGGWGGVVWFVCVGARVGEFVVLRLVFLGGGGRVCDIVGGWVVVCKCVVFVGGGCVGVVG